MKKMPPVEKVYEAWTALADHRVVMGEGYADVSSSDGEKSYVVRFSGNQYSSDDNATYWQGYPGYPVIAVLMLQGRLPLDWNEANLWGGINWTQLNKKHKNKYWEAVEEASAEKGIDLQKSAQAAKNVMEALEKLPIEIKRKIKD